MDIRRLLRENFRWIMGFMVLSSAGVLAVGVWLPEEGTYGVLGDVLRQLGIAGLIGSTVGIAFSEYYRRVRQFTIQEEISTLVAEVSSLLQNPSGIVDLDSVLSLKKAGVSAFYVDRKGPATQALRNRLSKLLDTTEDVTICLLGDTLRVFFHPGGDFTDVVYKIVMQKPNVSFRVAIINPNCLNALYRSEAETPPGFQTDEDYRTRSALFHDSMLTQHTVTAFNTQACEAHGKNPITLRYYDLANFCLLIILPDMCFTSQYICADVKAQVETVRLPLLVFTAQAEVYHKYKWHFEFLWRRTIDVDALDRSMRDNPIIARVRASEK